MTPAALHHAAEGLLAAGPLAASPAAPLAFRIILDGLRGAAAGGHGTGAFAPREARPASEREAGLLAAAFADCEALAAAMALAMAAQERCKALDFEPGSYWANRHGARAQALDEFALALSVGQHRTDAYDPDTLAAAHRAAVNRPLAARAGRAVSPAKAAAARANGAKGGRPKKEIQ